MSYQPSLLPLRVIELRPTGGTADLREIAVTADGHEFAVRDGAQPPGVAASEWIGYRIAHCAQVAVPYCAVLDLPDGRRVFGSRWEGATVQFHDAQDPAAKRELLASCAHSIGALLAADLFAGNEDRHLGNLLFRRNQARQWSMLAIDWSRALFVRGFPADTPLGPCNTATTIAVLRQLGLWDRAAAQQAMTDLQAVSHRQFGQWLAEMPPAWLAQAVRDQAAAWWQGADYHARIVRVLALL